MPQKKQCGIITYHFAANYGAVLQCYALKTCLIQSGIDSSVINFISDSQENNNSLYRHGSGLKIFLKNLVLLPFHTMRSRRINRFKKFINDFILDGNTDKIQNLKSLKEIIENKYFCVISGSDQVFNPRILDFNKAFLLPFETNVKKVGYAVSTGGASAQELMPFKDNINQFDDITARENTTIKTLSLITDKKIIEVCDPVFLLHQQQWQDLIHDVPFSNYLVCYFVKTKNLKAKIRLANMIAKERGLKLIILSARVSASNFGHTVVLDGGPFEFLSLFANSEYVCTDSFHGTSFALIFNKCFSVFEEKAESSDGRKTCLLKKVRLLNHVHYIGEPWSKPEEIRFDSVNKQLRDIREESKNILLKMIDNAIKSDI